jgi:alkylation response protein AidB-like acyl-CoA dehydrogenase
VTEAAAAARGSDLARARPKAATPPAATAEETRQLAETAREFARRELEPHASGWDRERAFPAGAVRGLAELGFLGLTVPEEEGGSGFGTAGYCAAVEEISRAVPALGLLLAIHNGPVTHLVRTAGRASARERWIPALASGEALGAFLLTEPDAGSDVAAIRARARRADGGWRLDGVKAWVAGAGVAGVGVTFARTPRAPAEGRTRDLAAFVVDLGGPGVRAGAPEETMGLRSLPVGEVRLDGATVPEDALLGEEGAGFDLAIGALSVGRLGVAAQALGIAGRCLDLAVEYASERRQFGRPVGEFQGVRLPLAELAARVEAARALLERTATERDAGAAPGEVAVRAAMAKLLAADLAMACATQAVQAFGGYGYVTDYPVERFFRDAKACQLYEGTNEIQRVVIGRRLFGA